MWAGSRSAFHAPIALGAAIERRTRIQSISRKRGTSGELAFITLRHEIVAAGAMAVVEEQDLVYRGAAAGSTSPPVVTKTIKMPREAIVDRKSTRLNSSHYCAPSIPPSA